MKDSATADFLFEIGCEEIPAGMLPGAIKELKVILDKYLSSQNLILGSPIEVYGAPRRLSASCASLRIKQPDEVKEVTGPPKSVSYDASGKPTKAAEGFAQKMNVPVDELVTISTPKGEYLSAKQVILGRSAKDILEDILPRTVGEIPWPRNMYWTSAQGLHFIRPIRWVVALLGGKTLRVSLGDAVSGDASSGHRFLGKAKIPVRGAKDYVRPVSDWSPRGPIFEHKGHMCRMRITRPSLILSCQIMCATGFRIAVPANTGRRRISARASIVFRFQRFIFQAGSTLILKAPSPAISRCAVAQAVSLRAPINT